MSLSQTVNPIWNHKFVPLKLPADKPVKTDTMSSSFLPMCLRKSQMCYVTMEITVVINDIAYVLKCLQLFCLASFQIWLHAYLYQ